MHLSALAMATMLAGAPAAAEPHQASPPAAPVSSKADQAPSPMQDPQTNLPVSLDKIKGALEQPVEPLRGVDANDTPLFKVSISERQRVSIDDLVKNLDFRSGPTPPGGLRAYEQQRQMFPAVDNPLRQPYSEYTEPQLLTIMIENLAGQYLVGRVANAITAGDRARAEAQAREDVMHAVAQYCAAQPNGGAGIEICANPGIIR
jgi:hypothetical protein